MSETKRGAAHASLSARYSADVQSGRIAADDEQRRVITILERLAADLHSACEDRRGWFARMQGLFGSRAAAVPLGVYLWGGVGRGKTYLMDLFFDSLEGIPSRRTHFHRFMQGIHARLTSLQGEKNPLEIIAAEIAAETRVLCFDEFFVQDIADAMILAGLLEALFGAGVVLVTTSNIEPSGLYRNGLQRARFLPAIALLEQKTEVVEIRVGADYRLRNLEQATLYHSPADAVAESAMAASLSDLVARESHLRAGGSIELLGRELAIRKEGEGVVWFDFGALCDGPRSAFDYVELARLFHTVLLSGIPRFDETNNDQARRFINLIDELYDRRVKLIASGAEPILGLYQGTSLRFEFERTASRLLEMQSTEYLGAAHRA
ncbi:MAG: cell division protein ZapE [Gammaproteobacteria bacterium]|nr:cell division protein ZapE [Gammaproteobacteria bacterium]